LSFRRILSVELRFAEVIFESELMRGVKRKELSVKGWKRKTVICFSKADGWMEE